MRLYRWARLEETRVQEEEERAQTSSSAEAGGAEVLSHQEKLARRNQIFNTREGFAMLSKELSEMMQCPVRSPPSGCALLYAMWQVWCPVC